MDWSRDGQFIAVGYTTGFVEVWDADTHQQITLIPFSDVVNDVVWHPENTRLLAIGGGEPGNHLAFVHVYDIITNEIELEFEAGSSISGLSWNQDGSKLAVASNPIVRFAGSTEIIVWDMTNEEPTLRLLPMSDGNFTDIEWSPDNQYIAAGLTDSTVRIWDVVRGEIIQTLQGHTAVVQSVGWNPDSTQLVSTAITLDRRVKIWDFITGETITSADIEWGGSVVWSPDGEQIAVYGVGIVTFFEAESLSEIVTIQTDPTQRQVVYSPYGGRAVFAINRDVVDGLQVLVPNPSLERLKIIAEMCIRDSSDLTEIEISILSSVMIEQLPNLIEQVELLPEDAIPPACRADLLAVAEALQALE